MKNYLNNKTAGYEYPNYQSKKEKLSFQMAIIFDATLIHSISTIKLYVYDIPFLIMHKNKRKILRHIVT